MDGRSISSSATYCQMSSSVQSDRGNTRMCSPARWRPLNSDHSSGRWFFGSHCPNSSRKEKTRSLARAFSSSRRAPPKTASKRCSVMASRRVRVWSRLRDGSGPASSVDPAGVDRLLHRGHHQVGAQLGHGAVAELEHLGEVVAGVDVHDRERDPPGPEGLLGQPEHDHRVLAAREQQHRPLELGRHLADDVDRLRLDVLELGQLVLT